MHPDYHAPEPIDQAIAAVHSDTAGRNKRATVLWDGYGTFEQDNVLRHRSFTETDYLREPQKSPYPGIPAQHELAAVAAEVARRTRILGIRQIARQPLLVDIAADHNHPDRAEAQPVWDAYAKGVDRAAFEKGNKAHQFVSKVRELVDARTDAEAYGDSDAVRSIERRLDRLTGISFPQLPAAAWAAADLMPAACGREYQRLTAKYGERSRATKGAAGKAPRRKLSTRPMSVLTETR